MNGLALCAGIGGLELGLKRAIPEYRTVCYVERNAYAATTLMARMEEKALDQAPIWDDLKSFDGLQWRGKVDIISSGFPCQPFSIANQTKRKGIEDERWLWPYIERIICEIEPSYIFLENVPGLISMGLKGILYGLAAMGFNAKWGCFSARSIGAPHFRERFFCLAYANGRGLEGLEQQKTTRKKFPETSDIILDEIQMLADRKFIRKDNGIPRPMDRIKCLGNAVVPQQAEMAFKLLSNL